MALDYPCSLEAVRLDEVIVTKPAVLANVWTFGWRWTQHRSGTQRSGCS